MLGAMALGLVLLAAPAAQAPVHDLHAPGPTIPTSPGPAAGDPGARMQQLGP
jgi:hypothetical protein